MICGLFESCTYRYNKKAKETLVKYLCKIFIFIKAADTGFFLREEKQAKETSVIGNDMQTF